MHMGYSCAFTTMVNVHDDKCACYTSFRFPCKHCSKTFQTANTCYKHELAHAGKPHACTSCDKTFQFPKELELHMRVRTGMGLFTCKLCGCMYTTNCTFNQHIKKHTDAPVKCPKCTLTFSTKADLDQCYRGQHGPSLKALCGKTFKWPARRNHHQKKCKNCKQVKHDWELKASHLAKKLGKKKK